jgi:hypothetical protein
MSINMYIALLAMALGVIMMCIRICDVGRNDKKYKGKL